MSDYVLVAAVEFDLDEIWEHIAADSIDAADRWIAKLFEAFEVLARTPGMDIRVKISLPTRFCFGPSTDT